MSRVDSFLVAFSAFVALAVGSCAVLLPSALLASKGVALPNPAATIWMREVGVTILASGVLLALVRRHPDSGTLRAVFWSSAIVHLGLLPIELLACGAGQLSAAGTMPNSILHVALGAGFTWLATRKPKPI